MKGIPELRLKSLLPDHLRYAFMVEMDKKSIDRIQIISWLAVMMYSALFYLDYKRYLEGLWEEDKAYQILFYLHLSGLLYLIPALATTFAKEKVKATRLSRAIIIWLTVLFMTCNLLGQSYYSFHLYLSLSLFMIYVLVANWAFTMNNLQRILFNLGCIIVSLMGINLGVAEHDVRWLISLYEAPFFTVIAFLFGTFDYNLRAAKFLEERELVKEKARIEELELMKSRMYTNLTHEFRTPLTVIAGMATQIQYNPTKWGEKGPEMIKRNTSHILNIVNQILDLSKLESGTMPLRLVHGDVIAYLRYIIDSFHSFAESKKIQLHFLTDVPELMMDYDPEKSITIISNLISNAIKFTPEGGNVYVRVNKIELASQLLLEIRIRDSGIGIPEDKLSLIFDRFYQIADSQESGQAGTGIGLAIVKEMVKLMKGGINVSSKMSSGTEFILHLPVNHDIEVETAQFVPASIHSAVSSWLEPQVSDNQKAAFSSNGLREALQVLVIEDNADVIAYIASVLKGEYHLLVAPDGNKGVETALNEVPDLIITDLMMPGMNGYDVCRTLKLDDRTSHIPIIMLTARADRESKIEGLQSGADAYIPKPFDQEELLVRIRQLIDIRKKLQARYTSSTGISSTDHSESSKEDVFIAKVREAIHTHLDDSAFGILGLCRTIGMSRTQLHNKLKALTGKSASHFIRSVRLAEAQNLLKTNELTIAEIAYSTGFNDPGYFSRVYREEFGEAPSEFRS